MKYLIQNPEVLICSCPNQHLLLVGDLCELCMGMVSEQTTPSLDFEDEIDRFDEQYFEKLEALYDDITYAA